MSAFVVPFQNIVNIVDMKQVCGMSAAGNNATDRCSRHVLRLSALPHDLHFLSFTFPK